MNSKEESDKLLMLKVTNRCNNKCIFCCDRKPEEPIRDLDLKVIENFLGGKGESFSKVHIIGGEPTLYPSIIELTEIINGMGYDDIYLETNATNFSVKLIKTLVNNGVKNYIVGLHTVSDDIYLELTGNKKGLENCSKNVKEIVNQGGKVIVNLALQSKNYKDIGKIIDYINMLGVNDFIVCSIIPPIFLGYSFSELVPRYSDVYQYLFNAIASNPEINISLQYFPYCILKDMENYRLENNASLCYIDMGGNPMSMKIDWTSDICTKRDACKLCKYNTKCNGVFKQYIANFGWEEFKPILN